MTKSTVARIFVDGVWRAGEGRDTMPLYFEHVLQRCHPSPDEMALMMSLCCVKHDDK
jgi:hypothetical protein